MLWGSRLRTLLASPSAAPYRILGKDAPDSMWRRYADLCRQSGLKRSVFVLSFDCDTDLDIRVVEGVHERLVKLGIPPVYAVPGELLERGSDTYRRVAADAAEFMNHGYVHHTTVDPRCSRYVSSCGMERQENRGVAAARNRGAREASGFCRLRSARSSKWPLTARTGSVRVPCSGRDSPRYRFCQFEDCPTRD